MSAEETNVVDQSVQVNAMVAELEMQRNGFAARCVTFAAESAAKSSVISQLHERVKALESIEAKLRDQIATRSKKAK